jgi:thiamine phosphate synthase YjbQ (UPF0047 family)
MKDEKMKLNAEPEARKEFIKVAPNVHLHVTDFGEGEGSELVSFNHSGHALFIEETDKFNQELENFILS